MASLKFLPLFFVLCSYTQTKAWGNFPKIINGTDAYYGQFPYQTYIEIYKKSGSGSFCGGSIYNQHYILTAAHCLYDPSDPTAKEAKVEIFAGVNDLFQKEPHEQRREVEKIYIHESYSPKTFKDDIAILQLKKPLKLTEYVKPIIVPDQDTYFSGSGTVSGWGETLDTKNEIRESKGASHILKYVELDIIGDKECREAYPHVSIDAMCAGFPGGGKDSCTGDSGGPFVCKNGYSEDVICGIVSYGKECALPKFPGVYTKVSHYTNWIYKTTGDA